MMRRRFLLFVAAFCFERTTAFRAPSMPHLNAPFVTRSSTTIQAKPPPDDRVVSSPCRGSWQSAALASLLSLGLLLSPLHHQPAQAVESRVVGQLQGSGLVFKDTLLIESFDDPKVRGVKLYISNFQRPITERLNAGWFSDPAYTSVACARTGKGPVQVADNIAKGTAGEEVFEESRSLLFKTLRVQRIYDEQSNTIVYVSFNTRLDKSDDANKSRFKSSLCAISLD